MLLGGAAAGAGRLLEWAAADTPPSLTTNAGTVPEVELHHSPIKRAHDARPAAHVGCVLGSPVLQHARPAGVDRRAHRQQRRQLHVCVILGSGSHRRRRRSSRSGSFCTSAAGYSGGRRVCVTWCAAPGRSPESPDGCARLTLGAPCAAVVSFAVQDSLPARPRYAHSPQADSASSRAHQIALDVLMLKWGAAGLQAVAELPPGTAACNDACNGERSKTRLHSK